MKPLNRYYDALPMITYQYGFGSVFTGLSTLYCYDQSEDFVTPGVSGRITWISLAYVIVFASALNYFLCVVSSEALLLGCASIEFSPWAFTQPH